VINLGKYANELYEALIMLLFQNLIVVENEGTDEKSVKALFEAMTNARNLLDKIENDTSN